MPQEGAKYPEIVIKNHHERRLLKGHLWAFSNELVEVRKDIPVGSVVTLIREFDKKPFALGLYNPNSLISARIISRDVAATINKDFIKQHITEAATRRKQILQERNTARIVHSESDLLPGLVIEKYDTLFTFQIVSAGMEQFKAEIIDAIKELFFPEAIIEKNSSHLRKLEGLEEIEQLVFGSKTNTIVTDRAGTKFSVSLLEGQKTGFYLDQMDNRPTIRRYISKDSSVLDLFCNDGGFALNAALAGAKSVTAVDASDEALKNLAKNVTLNSIASGIKSIKADCFDYLKSDEHTYDLIILDPPSLAKSKKHIPTAMRAYTDLHRQAIRRLNSGGIIATASCSHNISREDFLETIRNAAGIERKTAVILEEHGAAPDHPVLITMPETEYLKFFVIQIV
ncbi:MAG TPA: class I SAM-dependent rRNA methyltransferase [Candidatus Kapabacteria bacterium]|nr:class I SAM-dependent rRNA methyltransferase [Candidatus Kapabacteria bacterium]